MNTPRLNILKVSLQKKEAAFDAKLGDHMDDVRSANGQPLNDKRNGRATMDRWERQNDSLRRIDEGIEKTKRAIEREEDLIANVEGADIPETLRRMVEAGELVQWRKQPTTFFVPGVDKGRIVWMPKEKAVGHRYLSSVSKEQYPAFRDAFNKARAELAKEAA